MVRILPLTTLLVCALAGENQIYKGYKSKTPLHYFKKWHAKNIDHEKQSLVARGKDGVGLLTYDKDSTAPTSERAQFLMAAHRAHKCPDARALEEMQLIQSGSDGDGLHHLVMKSERGLRYVVTKGQERMLFSDPPLCQSLYEKPGGKGILKEGKKKGGDEENLPADDPLVEDCLALFHRTALDVCGEEYEVELQHASMAVIDGMMVNTWVKMRREGGEWTKHRPSCAFEVTDDHTDASFTQLKSLQDPADDDPLPEEEDGLVATLILHVPLCDAADEDGVTDQEANAMMFLEENGMGELSRYKGYEWVNKVLPTVNSASLLQAGHSVASSVDLRQQFPNCFPDSGEEVVRNQAQCGSCWAFASASTTMNEMCISSHGNSDALANPSDRFEVAVSQIMACNDEQRGCNGGHAHAANSALMQGISKERDAPYGCAAGDPMNHFSQASTDCTGPPWGANCDPGTNNPDWKFGGVSVVNGETDMKAFLSSGHTLYATLDVYDTFMHLSAGQIWQGGGQKMGGHALACVGYGTQSGTPYWILQNSWGPDWADGGYGKILRGSNLADIETGSYYYRAWVEGGDVPPCMDGADTGLSAGGPNIPCSDANGRYGDLCNHPSYGATVSGNCPASCNACVGGNGDAAGWGSLLAKPGKDQKGKGKEKGEKPPTPSILLGEKKHLSSSTHAVIEQIKNMKKSDLAAVLNAVSSAMSEGDL